MELEGYFGTTNNAPPPEPDDDDDDEDFEFDGMSFGYGAILGIGSAILIAIIAIVIKINTKRKYNITSYEMNSYVDNDAAVWLLITYVNFMNKQWF